MNTHENLTTVKNYYHEMVQKNFEVMAKYLHPEVVLISPLATISGKDTVVTAAKNLNEILEEIIIKAEFCNENQVMVSYDFMFKEPIGILRSASLISFKNDLISKIELFYDARPFVDKEIFSS